MDGLVAERAPGSSAVQRRHVFGPGLDEPIVWYEGAGTADRRFLQADERGSIMAASDSAGAVQNVIRYDENGRIQHGNGLPRFLFTGQRYFGSPGIYYYKARFYEPRLGRFLQPDPIGYEAGMNLYAYVGGDPVSFRDPWGLEEEEQEIVVEGRRQGPLLGGGRGAALLGASRAHGGVARPAELLPYDGPPLDGNPAECADADCSEAIVTGYTGNNAGTSTESAGYLIVIAWSHGIVLTLTMASCSAHP